MGALTLTEFQKVLEPILLKLRSEQKTLVDFARDLKERPRPLSAVEYLLILSHECRLMYSRREKNYE